MQTPINVYKQVERPIPVLAGSPSRAFRPRLLMLSLDQTLRVCVVLAVSYCVVGEVGAVTEVSTQPVIAGPAAIATLAPALALLSSYEFDPFQKAEVADLGGNVHLPQGDFMTVINGWGSYGE